jgi:hypothetical protein
MFPLHLYDSASAGPRITDQRTLKSGQVASSAVAIRVAGLAGIGILFDHYARQASSWVYYPILLG